MRVINIIMQNYPHPRKYVSYWGNHELNGAVIDGSSAASYSNDYNTEGYFSVLYMITMQNIIFGFLSS